jgi:hypothetical protein
MMDNTIETHPDKLPRHWAPYEICTDDAKEPTAIHKTDNTGNASSEHGVNGVMCGAILLAEWFIYPYV